MIIKVINERKIGSLFHYAHFLYDCLFPEIICELYNYDTVIRKESLHQTIGNFSKIYNDVMQIKNLELSEDDFNNYPANILTYKPKEQLTEKIYFDKFRNFIFQRYGIISSEYNTLYPEILLIKRHNTVNLIDNEVLKEQLKKDNRTLTSGSDRREIYNIDLVEEHLKNKYSNFKSLFLEFISFEEQVKYFNNAKLIILAHGAAMANMFFCKQGTTIIEVTCNTKAPFFNKISNILKLNHIKHQINTPESIINCINEITL